jgi:hypothetical protein
MTDSQTVAAPPRLRGAVILTVLAAVLWLVVLVALANFYIGNTGFGHGGDTGMLGALMNLLAVAVAAVALWLLLLWLQILAAVRGVLPRLALLASVLLLAISLIAAFEAQNLVTPSPTQSLVTLEPNLYPEPLQPWQRWPQPPRAWPVLEPALAPPLFVALSFWALIPGMCRRVPAKWAYGAVFGGVLALSVFVFFMGVAAA